MVLLLRLPQELKDASRVKIVPSSSNRTYSSPRATAQVPIIKDIVASSKLQPHHVVTRKIKVVWDTASYHFMFKEWIVPVLEDEDLSKEVSNLARITTILTFLLL